MPTLKPNTLLPTREEDAAIADGIAADDSTRELDKKWFQGSLPAREALVPVLGEENTQTLTKRRGRPPGKGTKAATHIRFDIDLLDAFKATGDGWQTRMNDALRDWAKEHRILNS